ncbi:MAG: sodium-dependent transporter, partial [Candidatus Flemingiibacterium sp.]
MSEKRSSFSGKIGFVLAAAGSAVGLGNIWRFPYLAAKYGGGIFLLIYVILAVTFGFALMTAEIAIGRRTGLSAIGAYKSLDRRFGFIGTLASIVPVIILPYYAVIGGWVTKYFAAFISGGAMATTSDDYFGSFIGGTGEPILWFAIFMGITALIVLLGVDKGIEKMSKLMMPVLVLLTLIVAVYSVCMPGAAEGVIYYLKPDFSKFSIKTVLAAMGQLF